jgi:hypothetical protein
MNTLAIAIFTSYFKQIPRAKPLLRLRPNPKMKRNQGQITIQESAQFDGQQNNDEIVL